MNESDEKITELKKLIKEGKIEKAIDLIHSNKECHIAEDFVYIAFKIQGKISPQLIDATLEAFLNTRENTYEKHCVWLHCLCHFHYILWKKRLTKWIKKFNEVAFRAANELQCTHDCYILLENYHYHSKRSDTPEEFHLTKENLKWVDWSRFSE
jgi:hypothetical protein